MVNISTEEKGVLLQRGRVIGVPRTISLPFIHKTIKWVEASGAEWTIDRLKQVKIDFLRRKAGLTPTSQWIEKSQSSKHIFSGVFGALEAYADRGPFQFERVLALLNVYTAFLANRVTEKQARKFFSGVTAKACDVPSDVTEAVASGFRLSGLSSIRGRLRPARPLLNYFASPSKGRPCLTAVFPK